MELIREHEEVINGTWDVTIGNRIRVERQSDFFAENRFVLKPQFGNFIIGQQRDNNIHARCLPRGQFINKPITSPRTRHDGQSSVWCISDPIEFSAHVSEQLLIARASSGGMIPVSPPLWQLEIINSDVIVPARCACVYRVTAS